MTSDHSTATSQRRYDALLAGIPVAFLGTLAVAAPVAPSLPLAVALASLVAGALVADGLFLNPPTSDH